MRKLTILLIIFTIVLIQIVTVYVCFAWSSSNLYQEGDDIFDDWQVCRTRIGGEDGFLQVINIGTEARPLWTFQPVIAFESLGEYVDTAYRYGEQAADEYPDDYQRAEKIFYFVRDRVTYRPDIDQFGFDEFAQNADELANTIDEKGIAYGDCEDVAILLAVMYKGAGYRSAIVLCPGHAGAMVYLPDYKKARSFELNGESGWVWAEATGKTNPFGWFPEGQIEGPCMGQEVSAESIPLWQPPDEKEPLPDEEEPLPDEEEPLPDEEEPPPDEEEPLPDEEEPLPDEEEPLPAPAVTGGGSNVLTMILVFFIVVAIMGVIILLLRRKRVA